MAPQATLCDLPNELLISILSQLPTRSLLPLVAVSHRFYSLVLRILKQRLKRVTSSPDLRIFLECYQPALILSTPFLSCDYLYTDGLDDVATEEEGEENAPGSLKATKSLSTTLSGVYSHFRPVVSEENRRGRARPPRRRQSQQREGEEVAAPEEKEEDTRYAQDVYLGSGELFSQLCTVTNLVHVGSRPGILLGHVNVSDGLIRVWRDWLAARAAEQDCNGEESVLWADAACTVGVRFRVTEKDIRAEHPVLVASDEELPVAYRLEFEELLLRTNTLLVMAERSEVQEPPTEGFTYGARGLASYPTLYLYFPETAPTGYFMPH
ncbi:hypothetical protein VTK26DRAFT_8512 [Humicola hyalothermophila]